MVYAPKNTVHLIKDLDELQHEFKNIITNSLKAVLYLQSDIRIPVANFIL